MRTKKLYKSSILITALLFAVDAFSAQAPNPRSGTVVVSGDDNSSVNIAPQRSNSRDVIQIGSEDNDINSGVNSTGRSATTNVSRSATQRPSSTVSRSAVSQTTKNISGSGRSATYQNSITSVSTGTTSRAASSNVVRTNNSGVARAASSVAGASRAASARATAVFNDVSKIGGGYATCREAYATCMDQICATANDSYRRCLCSSKYTEFRNMEDAFDQAITLLAKFEDNNLNAIDKTAEEVAAMYSATEGEAAIKNDTSAASAMLTEIGNLLSGKSSSTKDSSASLGLLSVDFTSDLDDIWSNQGSSLFETDSGVDLASLEGQELYNQANKQCLQIVADSCENDAVLAMAKSAYSVLITQDCNIYEKNINSQKEKIEQTVRTAEKYLREARLEEYRAHNSADVNECIANVKNAITADSACGAGYKKCLDYTGAYINSSTGEVIYSPRLFQLENLITLDGTSDDVLGQNSSFNSFLNDKRIFAESALDSCRDISEIVWEEFKRQALIEIAQAQDEKIEEVKMSCVSTMAECYDTQTNGLKNFDNTTAQYAGAISAIAARDMCQEKVIACASLYGNTSGCKFDGNGHLTTGNSSVGTAEANQLCGLTSLLDFVASVDDVRISEGCISAVESYLTDTCTPTTGTRGYPWNCVGKIPGDINVTASAASSASLAANIKQFAINNCAVGATSYDEIPEQTRLEIEQSFEDIVDQMDYAMLEECEELGGYWLPIGDTNEGTLLTAFYRNVYGGNQNTNWGRCVENTKRVACLGYNIDGEEPVATYDVINDECVFTNAWYEQQCNILGNGYYGEDDICYITEQVIN